MKNNQPQKINLSSMQVLKTLQVLMQDNYTMGDIVKKLNENNTSTVFNSSVVSKYINTCRYCGIDIQRIQNKYYVVDLPFGMRLNNEEVNLLNTMNKEAQLEMSVRAVKIFNSFLYKINRYASKKIARVDKNNINYSYEIFERAIANKRKVKLHLKDRKEVTGTPITISEQNGRICFHVYSFPQDRFIDLNRISGLEVLDEEYLEYQKGRNIVFKLKGKLAKRYELRDNEKILVFGKNENAITNKCHDVNALLSRLMRYDNLCEIIEPKEVRKEMKQIIDNTLKNYGIE